MPNCAIVSVRYHQKRSQPDSMFRGAGRIVFLQRHVLIQILDSISGRASHLVALAL